MKNRILSKMITDELKFIALPVVVLDAVVLLAAAPFFGFTLDGVLGLLLGNAAMLANFILLGFSSERAVEKTAVSAKRYMLLFYLIRFAIMGAAMALAFHSDRINGFYTVIPLLYPKMIYTLSAVFPNIFRKKGG
ncbi:MAG: ATP synthase subunit I [Oscillospiraceae bacterium]|nr:ATP synthase subunit I [Oscillospiraceae bacterium]